MHGGMTAQGKEWIRKNCGTKCVLIEEKAHESSIALNQQEIPQKSKDVDDYLNCESCSRNKSAKKNA